MKIVWMLMVLMVGCWCPPAQSVQLWKRTADYFDFTMQKSCLGEKAAVSLETLAHHAAAYCEQTLGALSRPSGADSGSSGQRLKRGLIKAEDGLPLEVTICIVRRLGLITQDDQLNIGIIEDQLQKLSIDQSLKTSLAQVLNACKSKIVPLPDLAPGDPNRQLYMSVINFAEYKKCIVVEGVRACQQYDMTRYFSHLP